VGRTRRGASVILFVLALLAIPTLAHAQYPPISIVLEQSQEQSVVNEQAQVQGDVDDDDDDDARPVAFIVRDVDVRGGLPKTGSDVVLFGAYGAVLLAAGFFLVRFARGRLAFAGSPQPAISAGASRWAREREQELRSSENRDDSWWDGPLKPGL
jgi:LPXTG-motif cell wall-anchored protein